MVYRNLVWVAFCAWRLPILFTVCALPHMPLACVDLVVIFYYWLILAVAREKREDQQHHNSIVRRSPQDAHKLRRITLQRVSNARSCEFGDDDEFWLRWWWMSPDASRQSPIRFHPFVIYFQFVFANSVDWSLLILYYRLDSSLSLVNPVFERILSCLSVTPISGVL